MWKVADIIRNMALTSRRSFRGRIIEFGNVSLKSQYSDLYVSVNEIAESEVFAVLSIRSGSGDRTVQLNSSELDEFANLLRHMQSVMRARAC